MWFHHAPGCGFTTPQPIFSASTENSCFRVQAWTTPAEEMHSHFGGEATRLATASSRDRTSTVSRTAANSIRTARPRTAQSGRLAAGAFGLLVCLLVVPLAGTAQATEVVEVRIGNHPTYTRVVFETSAPAGYRIEREEAGGAKLLALTLDATSRERDISSRSVGVESIRIQEELGKTIARIRLRRSDLILKEMILSNPPRIVLDLEHPEAAAPRLAAAATTTPAASAVAPKPSATQRTKSPRPVAKAPAPAPRPAAPIAAKPAAVEPVAKANPAKAPATLAAEPEAPPATPAAPKPYKVVNWDDPAKVPGAEDSAAEEHAAAVREMTPGAHKPGSMGSKQPLPAPAPATDTASASDAAGPAVAQAEAETPKTSQATPPVKPAERVARATPPSSSSGSSAGTGSKTAAGASGGATEAPFDYVTIGAIAAGAVLLALIAMRLVRRRSLPNDLDVTTLAADAEAAEPEPVVARGPSDLTYPAPRPNAGADQAGAADEDDSVSGAATKKYKVDDLDEAVAQSKKKRSPNQPTEAYSLAEVSAGTSNEVDHAAGLFDDDDSEGEKAMDMEVNDLPSDRSAPAAPPPVMAGDSDLASLVQDLISRVGSLEGRLEEANDARERLERQVAAQSEELRVQRAAIARTQRALRSLSRTEEDQATEPALKQSGA